MGWVFDTPGRNQWDNTHGLTERDLAPGTTRVASGRVAEDGNLARSVSSCESAKQFATHVAYLSDGVAYMVGGFPRAAR